MRTVEMNALRSTAADWLLRMQNDELSVEEIADWQQWLATAKEHRQAFEQMQGLWQDFERLPDKTPPKIWQPSPFVWAAAAILLIGIGLIFFWPARKLTVFETAASEHREVTLPDGSHLTLGARSLAWIHFVDSDREVGLDRGEAYFDVAQDTQRPFVVRAGDATITALGTAFNVRKTGERVQVAVAQGAVKVRDTRVSAGEEITVEPAARTAAKVRPVIAASATAWRTGRLEYLGEPLKYVVADVNRYSRRQIEIDDSSVGELKVTGTVFEDDIDSWLRSVEDLLPVRVHEVTAQRIVLTHQ